MADGQVSVREIDWDVLLDAIEGEDRYKPDVAYEYSNGRIFIDLGDDSSLYNPD